MTQWRCDSCGALSEPVPFGSWPVGWRYTVDKIDSQTDELGHTSFKACSEECARKLDLQEGALDQWSLVLNP